MNPIGVTTRRFRFAALLAAALTTAALAAAGAAGATAASAGPAPQQLRPPQAPAVPTAPDPAADAGRYEVRLRSGRFVPAADRRSLPAAAARRLGPDASFHALAQLESVPSPAQRKAMAEAGVRLLGYLPRMTWRATVRAGLDPDDPRLSGVRSLFALDPMAKVDPSIAGPASGPAGLVVRFQEDVPVVRREAIARRSGATIVGRADSVAAIVILAPAEAVAGLAAEDEVAWVDAAPAMLQPANDGVRAALGVESLWTDPVRPLTGAGLDVLVFDQGRVDELHDDLAGRVVVGDPVGVANHSTHVAGTLAGNGARSGGLYAGAAPSSRVISYALGSFNAGIFMHSNPGDLEADFAAAISTHGADLANLSLGSNLRLNNFPCALYGDYAVTEALLDGIVAGSLGPRFPIVVAGGNERPAPACSLSYASTAPPAGAKNVLSIGAVHSDSLAMTSFSAWGPTDDGRLKPDLVGPGCQSAGDGAVTSTYGGNAYGTLCGTSQAAPAVTGVLALLLQDRRETALPDPTPSTLRALAYHTALDLGLPGPDFAFGYGLMRPAHALEALRSAAIFEQSVSHGETRITPVMVTDANQPFVATLVWDDPPASAGAAEALVNDLDLKVFDPAGVRRFPWTLDPAAPSAPAATDREDHTNNVEQVAAPAGPSGLWRVEVTGSAVTTGPLQSYSLVISAGGQAPAGDDLLLTDRRVFRCDDSIGVTLIDADLAGAGSVDVLVTSGTDPIGATVALAESSTPGAFLGSVAVGVQIAVAHGDSITLAHPSVPSAFVTVDCVAPVLSGAGITLLDARTARLTWMTDEPADTRVLGTVISHARLLSHASDLTGLSPCAGYGVSIASADEAGNVGVAPPVPFETLGEQLRFLDDIETGAPGWQNPVKGGGGNSVQWQITSTASASPIRSWTDSPGSNYRDNTENILISPPIDLTRAGRAVIEFRHRYAIEQGYDFGYVEYSLDGSSWSAPVATYSGITTGFVPARLSLPAEVDHQPAVRLRFRLVTDNSLAFDGWYVDDVSVTARYDCSEVENLQVQPATGTLNPRLSWQASPAASSYRVYRGDLPFSAPPVAYGVCVASQVTELFWEDPAADPALSYYYLVAGSGGAGDGTLGTDSAGMERPAGASCP